MEAYKRWVRKNTDFVHSLESLANGITWLLPERFSNSEIGPEAVYAFLGILSAVNQHIIDTTPARMQPPGLGEPSFPWPLCVSTLKDVETVVEVAAQHFYGEDGKWNFIAVTEAVKVLVRLAVFRDSGYKMLLQGGEVINVDKGAGVAGDHNGSVGSPSGAGGYRGPNHFPDYLGYVPQNLEGRAISALSRFGDSVKMASDPMWMDRLRRTPGAPASSVKKPTLSSVWSENGLLGRLFLTGEVFTIMRPLIYVLLIKRYGLRSWKPWLLSLAVDLTGMSILSCTTSQCHKAGQKFYQISSSEKDEVKRRKMILALYIVRDPFFTKYAKHYLEKTEGYLSEVPFIGFLTGKLVELIVGAQTRYTYTSGS